MIRSRALYTLLLYVIAPWVLARLWLRGRKESGYRAHIAERFGRYCGPPLPECIWVHAVSVGETRAAQPIVERLLARYPGYKIVFTHMTPTGRETGRQLYGERVMRCYLPYDFPSATARFLRHFKPRLGLIMETEIWPNLLSACVRHDVPVYLVNARLSEKSYQGYVRVGPIAASTLAALSGVIAQSEADAERFRRLGAPRVRVTGNLKFDLTPIAELVARGTAWREQIGRTRPVFLAASTREGEEALLLDVLPHIGIRNLLMIIVPRHPQRFDAVAQLLDERGLAYRRRSKGELPDARISVWLGDSMGEMTSYLAACDVAFIGGSLQPFGAHNLVEACALGKPVLIGPSVYNFQEAAALGIAAGAVVQVPDAPALAQAAAALLADPSRRTRMGAAGLEFANAHRGAVDRLFEVIGGELGPVASMREAP